MTETAPHYSIEEIEKVVRETFIQEPQTITLDLDYFAVLLTDLLFDMQTEIEERVLREMREKIEKEVAHKFIQEMEQRYKQTSRYISLN